MKENFRKEIEKIDKRISKLYKERNTIRKELLDYRISIGDYIPGDELISKEIISINIDTVLDSNFEEVYIPSNELVDIEDGRLYCSSYSEGILYYSDKDGCYIHCYYGDEEELDIKYIFLKDED